MDFGRAFGFAASLSLRSYEELWDDSRGYSERTSRNLDWQGDQNFLDCSQLTDIARQSKDIGGEDGPSFSGAQYAAEPNTNLICAFSDSLCGSLRALYDCCTCNPSRCPFPREILSNPTFVQLRQNLMIVRNVV